MRKKTTGKIYDERVAEARRRGHTRYEAMQAAFYDSIVYWKYRQPKNFSSIKQKSWYEGVQDLRSMNES